MGRGVGLAEGALFYIPFGWLDKESRKPSYLFKGGWHPQAWERDWLHDDARGVVAEGALIHCPRERPRSILLWSQVYMWPWAKKVGRRALLFMVLKWSYVTLGNPNMAGIFNPWYDQE